ncbi:MAG: tetratricopeptide repeat protein [Planctomycetota bacterium]|nr:tetratricopeptide repeat protein [Planctomycetota bacterium]
MDDRVQPGMLTPNSRFGHYVIRHEIGRGGMGIVYKALDTRLHREVALKVLQQEGQTAGRDQVERFLREARSAAKLRHAAIVQIHEVGQAEGHNYFTMDFIEGASLSDVGTILTPSATAATPTIKQTPPTDVVSAATPTTIDTRPTAELRRGSGPIPRPEQLTARRLMELMWHVADAIGYAHSRGIIHRDIKPENVLVEPSGKVYVTDFGLAKDVSGPQCLSLTGSGMIMGTPLYMSPEQARGEPNLTPASDVFSLGIVMYELLTGARPFDSETLFDVLQQIQEVDPPPPSQRLLKQKPAQRRGTSKPASSGITKIHRDLDTICMKALEKSTHHRYPNATALAEDIRRFLDGEPVLAHPPSGLYRMMKWGRRHPGMATAAVAVAVGLIAAVALWRFFADRQQANIVQATDAAVREREETRKRATPFFENARDFLDRARIAEAKLDAETRRAKIEEAVADLSKAIEIDPAFADAFCLRGNAHEMLGDYDTAVADFNRAAELNDRMAAPLIGRTLIRVQYLHQAYVPVFTTAESALEAQVKFAPAGAGSAQVESLKKSIKADVDRLLQLEVKPWQVKLLRGVLLFVDEKYEEAIAAFSESLEIFDSAMAHFNRGRAYMLVRRLDDAVRDLQVVLAESPMDIQSRIFLAITLLLKDDAAGAAEEWNRIALWSSSRGTRALALTGQAMCMTPQRKYQDAIDLYTRALEFTDSPATVLANRAAVRTRSRDYAGALKDLDAAIEAMPDSVPALNNRGNARFLLDDHEGAIVDFKRALALDPECVTAMTGLGEVLREQGKLDEAVVFYEMALKLKPNHAAAHHGLGLVHKLRGEIDKAIEAYDRAIELAGSQYRYYSDRGNAYRLKGDLERAVAEESKAIEMEPGDPLPYLNRASMHRDMRRRDLAESDVDAALKVDPSCADAHSMRAMMCLDKEDLEGAIVAADRAIELDPRLARAYVYRGHAKASTGKPDEAMKDVDRAVELDATNHEAFMIRGVLRMRAEEFEGAIEDFTRMAALVPDIPEPYANRALARLASGDNAGAAADLEKAVSLAKEDDPRLPQFKELLEKAKQGREER